MSTLVLRTVKGSPLTSAEIDANVINLNTDKADKASPTFTGTVTLPNSLLQVTASSYPTIQPTLNLDFANTKLLDPRITFVRNATAPYYDGQTTALAEQNLLLQSQDFRNTADAGSTRPWLYSGITNTYGAAIAPDGTTTANYLQETATTAVHRLDSSAVNSVTLGSTAALTCSIYFKKGLGLTAPDWIQISTGGASSTYTNFNLTTGLVGNFGGGQGITVTNPIALSDGWYRCIVTLATANAGIHYFYPAFTNNTNPTSRYPSYLGTITSDVQMWGFQIEQRSSATAYTKTTTTAITNYIPQLMTAPAGVARFDCDPLTGNSLGLLIEESRTNLVLQSQFASGFTFVRTTQNINTIIAPDGTLTASKIIPTNVNGSHAFYKGVTVVSGTSSTWSGYFKAGEYNTIHLNCQASASIYIVKFNLTSGTSTNVSGTGTASITLVGNGWYRCTATATTASTSGYWQFDICDNSGNTVYTGDGYSGIYIWGAQLEAGSFATSYIPTVASTVTRAADSASMTGTNFSSWYNQAQGSLYAESDDNGSNTNGAATLFNAGAAGNNSIAFYGTGVNTARLIIRLNTAYVINTLSSVTTQPVKQAASFKDGAVSGTANGSLFVTNVNVNIPHNLDTLYIGYFPSTVSYLTGHIRKISYYPVALSSSNLVALTS